MIPYFCDDSKVMTCIFLMQKCILDIIVEISYVQHCQENFVTFFLKIKCAVYLCIHFFIVLYDQTPSWKQWFLTLTATEQTLTEE